MAVYKIDSKKVQGQEGLVYLYLYKLDTGQRVPDLQSLKVKIPEKYWNASKMKISKELPDKYLKVGFETVELMNKMLSEKLEEFIKANGDFSFIPSDEKTVNDWIDIIVARTNNWGTKMRYKNIKNLLEQFQLYYSVEKLKRTATATVYFKSVDVSWISGFKTWLITINGNENNSSSFKVKALGGMMKKAHDERWYRYSYFPFEGVKHKFEDTDVEILNFDELQRFMNTPLIEVSRRRGTKTPKEVLWKTAAKENILLRNSRYKKRAEGYHTLDDIRHYWLFQLFSQGIRVSDLITLRWNDFVFDDGLRIKKKMFKTKKIIDILVSDRQTEIIERYILRYKELFIDEAIRLETLTNELKESISKDYFIEVFPNRSKEEQLINLCDNYLTEFYHSDMNGKGYYISIDKIEWLLNKEEILFEEQTLADANKIKELLEEHIRNNIREIKHTKFLLICGMIKKLAKHKQHKTNFVFNLMRNTYFADIDESNDFGYINEDQYRKFQSARTLYNNLLKIVAFQCDIEKNLTSHIARHSYTSLMIDLGENINLFDVMTSLGHKHIATTQAYIQRFSNKKIDTLNTVISNALRK